MYLSRWYCLLLFCVLCTMHLLPLLRGLQYYVQDIMPVHFEPLVWSRRFKQWAFPITWRWRKNGTQDRTAWEGMRCSRICSSSGELRTKSGEYSWRLQTNQDGYRENALLHVVVHVWVALARAPGPCNLWFSRLEVPDAPITRMQPVQTAGQFE